MTKSMLEKCLNKECVAFGKLPTEIKVAISDNFGHVERLVAWPEVWKRTKGWGHEEVVRLSPDTPTEPEYEEFEVYKDGLGYFAVHVDGENPFVTTCPSHIRFLGIIYNLNGVETLRTSVDAAFGTPVRVRFEKGDK